MRPIQLWLPHFDPAVSSEETRRDLKRAQQGWCGEPTIWLCQGLPEERRWDSFIGLANREWAMPAERANRIDVHHVGMDGDFLASTQHVRFARNNVDGLLEDWLSIMNGSSANAVRFEAVPPTAKLLVPIISSDSTHFQVRYEWIQLPCEPLGTFPTTVSSGGRGIDMKWPPGPGHPNPISPNAESCTHDGKMVSRTLSAGGYELPVFVQSTDPDNISLSLVDRWPSPFENVFPHGGGFDALLAQRKMATIAERSQVDPEGALQEALQESGAWMIAPGKSTLLDTWFLPNVKANGLRGVLCDLEGLHDISVYNEEELRSCTAFHDLINRPVDVTVAFGVVGFFWSLLLVQLEAHRQFRVCEHCRRFFVGPSNKKYCGPKDSPQCQKERAAKRQRKSRGTKKHKRQGSDGATRHLSQ